MRTLRDKQQQGSRYKTRDERRVAYQNRTKGHSRERGRTFDGVW